MSTSALESALSGLRIAQQQLNVISTNISNVQTPGYTRKILPQSVRTVENTAVGVTSDPLIRNVDISLERDLWTQISSVSSLDTTIKYLEKIEQFHGAANSTNMISAEISSLKDAFSSLSDEPTNSYLQNAVVIQAQNVAEKFNEFSALITQLRNDSEDEISTSINSANGLLEQIADLNKQAQSAVGLGRSMANIADLRDNAIKDLSKLIDISFFTRGDGVMVIQTKSGVQLADENATPLFFRKTNIGTDQYYPNDVNGVYLGGDPNIEPNATDITPFGLGGQIGALIDLRDNTLPQYQAQLDELAYRMAQRFDNEGLRLFTNENGGLPLDTAPIPNPPGPLTSVDYTGFSSVIRVNQNIIDDSTLIQTGTNGDLVQEGSNEVIRRVLDFTFGTTNYESVNGTRDIRVSANAAGDTLQENFGLWSQNQIETSKNLTEFVTDLNVAPGNPFLPTSGPPLSDEFTMRIYDTRTGSDSGVLTIDLTTAATNYPIGSAGLGTGIGTVDNAAEQLASYLNSLAWPADMDVRASVNSYGQMVINTRGNMTIGEGTMGANGLKFIGLEAGTVTTTDPYFDIQVGNDPAVRITLEPGDTETDLVNKIDAVPGIDTADIIIDANGYLSFRPQRGGDINLIGGPFTSSSSGFSTTGGKDIVTEIFGSGHPITAHAHASFRSTNLGASVGINTEIVTGTSITDYGQKMVNTQTQDLITAQNMQTSEDDYRSTLEKTLLDQSAVNVDEELANLIVIQSAYAAAAKAITTVNDMFKELLNSI